MLGLFLLFFIIFIALPIGMGYLIYFMIKTYWNKKYAKYFAIIYSMCFLIFVGQMLFEDQLFSKNDAKELIEEQNFFLNDDFRLLNNKTESAIGDYYHTFEIQISENDKFNAINNIKNSSDFKSLGEQTIDYLYSPEVDRYVGKKRIQNYETKAYFVREYFQPNGQGYAPTFRRIKIKKSENVITFEDIDE